MKSSLLSAWGWDGNPASHRLAVKCRFPRLPETGSTVDGKVPASVIFLLTAPLASIHIHPLSLGVIPPACCGLLRIPRQGFIILRCTPCLDFKNREREAAAEAEAAVRSSAARGIEEENRHKTFCKCYGGKNGGANSFVFLCKSNWDH